MSAVIVRILISKYSDGYSNVVGSCLNWHSYWFIYHWCGLPTKSELLVKYFIIDMIENNVDEISKEI